MLLNFGETLFVQRRKLGLTIKETAKRCGISQMIMYKYEKSISYPSVRTLYKLCSTLNLDYNEMYELLVKERNSNK